MGLPDSDEIQPKTPAPRPRRRRSSWGIKLTPAGLLLLLLLNAALLALAAWPLLELRQILLPSPVTALLPASAQPSPSATQTATLTATLPPEATPEPSATLAPPTLSPTAFPPGAHPLLQGLIVLALQDGLHTHLFAYLPEGSEVQISLPLTRLTNGPWDDTSPALSPDGKRMVFASSRSGYWDLYLLELATGLVSRLTDSLDYEGSPAWSPDGVWVIYEAYVENNLEIFITPVDASQPPIRLTDNPAADHSPVWSPQGRQIAFVSTRSGNSDIWLADLDQVDENLFHNLSSTPGEEAHPAWARDGSRLAWSAAMEGFHNLYLWDSQSPQSTARLLGGGDWPVFNPDGSTLLAGLYTPNRHYLAAYPTGEEGGLVLPPVALQGALHGLDWGSVQSRPDAQREPYKQAALETPAPLWLPQLGPAGEIPGRQQVVELPDVQAPQPYLHDMVDENFNALRQQLAQEIGWDYLSALENAYVPLTSPLDPGMSQSWLYTGRAFAVVSVPINAGWMAVLREDFGQQTYWRVYLRARFQDGSAGAPLTRLPWDFNARLGGDVQAYEEGGLELESIPPGYWVDFTQLAASYGWERQPALSFWRAAYPAARFNEFVLTGGLDWKAAMLELYPPEALVTPSPVVPPTITPTFTPRWYQSPTPTDTSTPRPTLTPILPSATPTRTPRPTLTPRPSGTPTEGIN